MGAAGQTQTKELPSEAAAQAHVAKLVAEKEKKGYRSGGSGALVSTAPEPVAATSLAPEPATTTSPTPKPATTTSPTPKPIATASPVPEPVVEAPALDEETWTMPAEWLAQAMPRRDVTPLPEFAADSSSARRFREQIAAQAAKIDEALKSPEHDPSLVRALRNHREAGP